MGTILSTETSASQSPEQRDLQLLGDRFPFTDCEIRFLYAAYTLFQQIENRNTFLFDWSYSIGSQGLFEVLHDKILPKSFGNALYEAAFCSEGDTIRYCETINLSVGQNGTAICEDQSLESPHIDEYVRRARLEKFFDGLARCSRRGPTSALEVLFQVVRILEKSEDATFAWAQRNLPRSKDSGMRVSAELFVHVGYLLSRATTHLQQPETQIQDEEEMLLKHAAVKALAHSIVAKAIGERRRHGEMSACPHLSEARVELQDILNWAEAVTPMFGHCLPTFFHYCLFPTKPIPRGRTAFEQPCFNVESFVLSSRADRFALACTSHALNGPWCRLYTSAQDGLSFNRLLKAILGYGGPTIFVIQSVTGAIFGAYSSAPWKEAKDFYGNTDCFLYQLKPTMNVYRPTGSASNFMYCNPSARSRGYDQQAHGIGFGGTTDQPRLFLTEHLDDACHASNRDLTFENGRLENSHDSSFFVDIIEVWGVGGEEAVATALEARSEKRAQKDEAIRKARKVDKAQFLDDFRAGTFDSKAFAHRQQVDGRGREDMDDRARDKSKEYEYTK